MSTPTVRIRGIYATALTKLLLEKKWKIAQMSEVIGERLGVSSSKDPADIDIRQNKNNGLMAIGEENDLKNLKETLEKEFLDIFFKMEKVQLYGIYKGKISEKKGRKSIIDIKDGTGLCYEFIKDESLLQVFDINKRPILRSELTFPGKNVVLLPNRAVKISRKIKDPEERERLYELGKKQLKDFGILFRSSAIEKEKELIEEIKELYDEAEKILNSSELFSAPSLIRKGKRVLKIDFGWDSKKKLDSLRSEILPTMKNHHLYKNSMKLSAAINLGEKVIDEGIDKNLVEKNFLDVFQSCMREYIEIEHIKAYPIILGEAEVLEFEYPKLVLRRNFLGRGYYDGLNIKKEFRDYAITEIEEEKWYFTHKYYSKDDELKGIYYNICTPVEIYPDKIRYFDLEIDVVEDTEGNRRIIDKDRLEKAIEIGRINEKLGKKAIEVAESLVS